jgi:arylformamidase
MGAESRLIELSHELVDGMAAYPGLPSPRIGPHLDHEQSRSHYEGDEFFLGKVEMPANVGTYLDSPYHRFREREDLSQIPLWRLVGLKGLVIDATGEQSRALSFQVPADEAASSAVLIRTGWDSRWGTNAYWEPGPYLAEDFATQLVEADVGLVGVDCWNVDDTTTKRRPVHTELLQAGIIVVEHLCNLDRLPPKGFLFSAPVLRIRGGASFPVRAFAELEENSN